MQSKVLFKSIERDSIGYKEGKLDGCQGSVLKENERVCGSANREKGGAKTDRRIGDVAVTSETNVVRIDTLSYRGN